ncbi:MAG: sugar phosphate isomerase/epimerase [Clostridia bacterium]|nr:sugar phosphate isomerase/epimerase [Clostridia bacterium]
MRLGISTSAFFGRWETDESAMAVSKLPVDCAEVFLQTPSEYTREFGLQVRKNLAGIPCTSVHPLGTLFENQLISRSARQRRDALDILCAVLDAAQVLGAQMYVHHGRHTPRNEILPWNMQANAELISIIEKEASERGIAVTWENVCWCQLTSPDRVRDAKRILPDVRFTLDIKQAMKSGYQPVDFIRAMGNRISNVHICDWDDEGRLCLPGEGSFDFETFIHELAAAGYDGPIILEPYLALIRSEEALNQSIQYIKEVVVRNRGLL